MTASGPPDMCDNEGQPQLLCVVCPCYNEAEVLIGAKEAFLRQRPEWFHEDEYECISFAAKHGGYVVYARRRTVGDRAGSPRRANDCVVFESGVQGFSPVVRNDRMILDSV